MFPSSNSILSITSVLAIWLHAVCYKELSDKEFKIDIKKLEKKLGTKVVKISALKETGIDDLIRAIELPTKSENINIFDPYLENAINEIISKLDRNIMNKKFYKTMRIIIVAVEIFLLLHFNLINI